FQVHAHEEEMVGEEAAATFAGGDRAEEADAAVAAVADLLHGHAQVQAVVGHDPVQWQVLEAEADDHAGAALDLRGALGAVVDGMEDDPAHAGVLQALAVAARVADAVEAGDL